MKKIFLCCIALLPFMAASTFAAPNKPAVKQTQSQKAAKKSEKPSVAKSNKAVAKTQSAVKNPKVLDKKRVEKKVAEKKATAPKVTANKKAIDKKTLEKKVATKTAQTHSVKKAQATPLKSAQKVSQKTASSKTKVQTADKATTQPVVKAQTAKPVSHKAVIVPKCQDAAVLKVLSSAFQQQGKATGANMNVKTIAQIKETQFYPQNNIRGCYADVTTTSGVYATDYSLSLSGEGFFVQVENASVK